jgi:sulfur carrier protein
MITVNVNGHEHKVDKKIDLKTLLEVLQIGAQGIAVAVNEHIISKEHWTTQQIEQNDNILIIRATQGG